jgi:hypothetical protein
LGLDESQHRVDQLLHWSVAGGHSRYQGSRDHGAEEDVEDVIRVDSRIDRASRSREEDVEKLGSG